MPAESAPAAGPDAVARRDGATVPHLATSDPAIPAGPATAADRGQHHRARLGQSHAADPPPATVCAAGDRGPSGPARADAVQPSSRGADDPPRPSAATAAAPAPLGAPAMAGDRHRVVQPPSEAPLAIGRQQPGSPTKPPMGLFRPTAPSAAVLDSARQAVEAVVASGLAEVGPGGAITISRQAQATPPPAAPAPPPAPVAVQRDVGSSGGGYPSAAEPEPAAADRDRAAARSMYPHLRQMLLAELRTDRERSGGLRGGRR